jgi:hypothetical protein
MNTTTIRSAWNGVPVPLQTLWALTKGSKTVALMLYTHQLGWECRVDGAGILLTQVYRSDQEIEEVSAEWKRALTERGWS